jgi:ABC-type polysaccharide/polyol phosphate export permease
MNKLGEEIATAPHAPSTAALSESNAQVSQADAEKSPIIIDVEQEPVKETIEKFESIAELSHAPNHEAPVLKEPSFPVYVFRTLNELRFVKFALYSFVTNNLRRRYQRSVLGFAWSLLSPLAMMIVLTTVFSLLFHRDPKSYGIYVLTGMLPWQFISESIAASCVSITAAEAFMKKVYIPKIFFPLVTVATESINFSLSLVSMTFLALFVGLQLHWTLLLLPFAMGITFVFLLGMGLSASILTVYFRDFVHLVRVILQTFFYLIPIVYPLNMVPAKYEALFRLNPFTYFIMLYRQIIFYGQVPTAQEWGIPILLSVGALLMGFFMLQKKEKDIIFRL